MIADLGPKATKLFKPETWTALEELRINREAIAAGLLEIPPTIVAPIEANENLPLAPPTHTALQPNATANQIAVWKINAKITNDFVRAKAKFKELLMDSIPSDIYKTLELRGGTRGWAVIEPAQRCACFCACRHVEKRDRINLQTLGKKRSAKNKHRSNARNESYHRCIFPPFSKIRSRNVPHRSRHHNPPTV